MKLWCSHCKAQCPTRKDQALVCCYVCGKVISDDYFSEEPTFVKGPGGESRLAGSYVKSLGYEHSESHERTIDKGKDEIRSIALRLGISDAMIYPASSFYRIAVERKFTRGRRTTQVAAACLYIACRTNDKPKPYLLIDFSEALSVNVYVLGAVFLQLCQLLSLQEHNIVKRPIDPTLFIPRFTEKLLSEMNTEVSRTASRIIASMKRDWMQTGRKPSGICGAALYISALSHGFKFSKTDIGKIVHICEVTLTKRLIEFENTDSGSLTIEELNKNAMEVEKCKFSSFGSQESAELLCQHKESGSPFAHGLCKDCFEDFIEISGGLGGSDPPAFQHAERMRQAEESAKKPDESDEDFMPELEKMSTDHDKGKSEKVKSFTKLSRLATKNQRLESMDCPTNMDAVSDQVTVDSASDNNNKSKDASTINNDDDASTDNNDESDGLSDIDDVELSGYLNNEEETRRKAAVWEEMNREYLEEQAAKIGNGESAAKPKKERRQKRALDDNPAQTAAEATRQMLSKKRISSKINYDALDKCFTSDLAPDSNKKLNPSSDTGDKTGKDLGAEEHDSHNMNENVKDYEDLNLEYGGEADHEYGYSRDYDESNLEYGYDDGYDEQY